MLAGGGVWYVYAVVGKSVVGTLPHVHCPWLPFMLSAAVAHAAGAVAPSASGVQHASKTCCFGCMFLHWGYCQLAVCVSWISGTHPDIAVPVVVVLWVFEVQGGIVTSVDSVQP